jgi:hypothetical protein
MQLANAVTANDSDFSAAGLPDDVDEQLFGRIVARQDHQRLHGS